MNGTVLRAEGLGKAFAGRTIFEAVDLEVTAGEAIALTGPSGTGKTTLLRCLNGLEQADQGRVVVGALALEAGATLARRQSAALAIRRRVGFVFQGCHLFSHRTVLENVMEGPVHVRRERHEQARVRAVALLDQFAVSHRALALPRELSGGELQRAAIARALAMQPEVLLLDEPTSALDPARADSVADLLRAQMDGGLAVVTVTHDERFASRLGARVLRLEAGRLSRRTGA